MNKLINAVAWAAAISGVASIGGGLVIIFSSFSQGRTPDTDAFVLIAIGAALTQLARITDSLREEEDG